jgi:CRP/FNR family transcriptional regulator
MPAPDAQLLVDFMSRMPYFKVLSRAELSAIARQAVLHTFSPDEVIFLQGDSSSGLWLIADGTVKISKLSPEGDEFILHLLGPGQAFNDISVFDGGPTPANATAMTLVQAWSIPAAVLVQALEQHPAMALALVKVLATRVRTLNRQLENVTLYPVMARLARFLLSEAENPAFGGPGVTRAAIASHLATTPETISRVLAKMQKTGAIRFDRHRILITNADLLQAIADMEITE